MERIREQRKLLINGQSRGLCYQFPPNSFSGASRCRKFAGEPPAAGFRGQVCRYNIGMNVSSQGETVGLTVLVRLSKGGTVIPSGSLSLPLPPAPKGAPQAPEDVSARLGNGGQLSDFVFAEQVLDLRVVGCEDALVHGGKVESHDALDDGLAGRPCIL